EKAEGWFIKSDYPFDRENLNFFKKWWIDIDKVNFLLAIFIIIFGLIITTSASPYVAKKIDADNLFFIKKQILFSIAAIFILTAVSFLDKEQIKLLSIVGVLGIITLLVVVFFFGSEAKGAKRWIDIFG